MEKIVLPQGDKIRQLLIKSNISNHNINTLLRDKGVFIGNTEKNNSVPLLMKTIVSPEDFIELYNTQKTKEDTTKIRTATIKCSNDIELNDVFSEELDLSKKILESHRYHPNFKLIGDPQFYFENNSAVLEYKIERENLLEDWTNNSSTHAGAVYITKSKDGDIELSVEQNSTSKETSLLNDIILSEVKKILQNKTIIKKEDDFIRIKLNDFTNSARIQFLYSFTKKFSLYLDFTSITDIDVYLDENEEAHKDVKAFLDEIELLKLKGKGLQKHVLLKNNKYHDKLIVASISLKYKFNIDGVKGISNIIISFPEYISKRNLSSELQISINFNVEKEYRKIATETQLRKKLYSHIEKTKITNYSTFKK